MIISIVGASGYVGSVFEKYLKDNQIEYITQSVRYPFNAHEFKAQLILKKVTHVINCAGYTGKPNVDACERDTAKADCLLANSVLPPLLADACNECGVGFSHISSGCIYNDHACERGYTPTVEFKETDKPNFSFAQGDCSWYSGTKALGEDLLVNKHVNIFRLRIPFNAEINHRNYIYKIINYKKILNATNSFSQLDEFVAAVMHIITRSYKWYSDKGIYNVTQPGYMNTIEVVGMLRKYNLIDNKEWFKDIEDFANETIAPRSNCVLDSSKCICAGVNLTPIHAAMENAIERYAYNLSKQ